MGVGGEDVVISKLEFLEAVKLRSEERGMFVDCSKADPLGEWLQNTTL